VLLFFQMEAIGNLLGDQGGVAAGPVVDDQVGLNLVLYGLVYDFCRVLDHLRISPASCRFFNAKNVDKKIYICYLTIRLPYK